MQVEIDQTDISSIKAALGELGSKYKTVVTTSINKTLTTAKTQATARIGNELNLKAARIKEDFTIQKANFSKLSGALIATGEPVGLVQFGANQTLKGVSVKVKRSGSRTLLKHAYIAKGRGKESTKTHIFWRANRDKMPAAKKFPVGKPSKVAWPKFGAKFTLPVERLTGPRIEDIFASAKVFEPVSIQAAHVYLQNVDTKIAEILRRYA